MAITYEDKKAIFTSVIYEDEVGTFRDFLQENSPSVVEMDFSECEDIHLAVIQLIMAYKKNYDCIYKFSDNKKLYETVLKGFDSSENHCN